MPRAYMLLLAAFAATVHGRLLDASYGYPFYSPVAASDDPALAWEESKAYLSAGYLIEPADFLATGPRITWSFWDYRQKRTHVDLLEIRKWEYGWSMRPQKRLSRHARLFLDASIGFEHMEYASNYPVFDPGSGSLKDSVVSKSEWGFGRSLGMGLEFDWLSLSVHHDAFLAKSLAGEFAGLRAAIGIVYRKRP